jgi:primosomal protein N' (replication factor Y)
VARLREKGLTRVTLEIWEGRDEDDSLRVPRPELQPAQADAVAGIVAALRAGEFRTFLLHGVTGSGKTEVYLRALEEARDLGRRAILLVPEITLTPQTVSRLRGRFGSRAAVVHSRLTDPERRRIWHAAGRGLYDVVLGPRSAVFAPLPELGLLLLDEENDAAYKQEDAPRYRARDVAIRRAERARGVVILGSATPDLETRHASETRVHDLLLMPDRISSLPLPAVRLVDLRGTKGTFTPELLDAIEKRITRREQVILFLNRRGFSPFVQCGSCGEAVRCTECAVSLTYHKADGTIRCHYCDHAESLPDACPACGARQLFYRGAGTQRIEEELREAFPDLRLARLDSDSVRRTGSHEEILEKFLEGKIDVLLGTQMVAKGLDFPRVTLVGVINADTGLHLPDYRAAERTFQILAQVSGRAGRSELGGEVLIQTRCPEHVCLRAASGHDEASFRATEMEQRRALRYPPFAKLASVLVRGVHLPDVEKVAAVVRDRIAEAVLDRPAWSVVLGPAPAALAKLRGKHRLRLLIKGERREDVRACAARALETPSRASGVEIVVDVDPVDML